MSREFEIQEKVESLQQILDKIDVLVAELTIETGRGDLTPEKRRYNLLSWVLADYTQKALDSAKNLLSFVSIRQQDQTIIDMNEGGSASGIKKRKDGRFEKRFTFDGKRYSVFGATAKEVAEKEFLKRKELEQGIYKNNSNIRLDEYFQEWIERKKGQVKSNTISTYSDLYYSQISPHLGKLKVQKIERRQVLELQKKIQPFLKNVSVNYCIDLLSCILKGAVKDEVIQKNPAKWIDKLKTEPKAASKTIHRALTLEEQKSFIEALEGEYYREFVLLLLCTGMRFGEVAVLTWGDIDRKKNVIHVTKTLTKTEDGKSTVGSTPKTSASLRDIPLNESINKVLKQQREKLIGLGIIPFDSSKVFIPASGKFASDAGINSTINRAAQKARIDHITAHAMRDTFATRFLEETEDLQTLKTILGHESLAMTADLYAHVLSNTKQKKMDLLVIDF